MGTISFAHDVITIIRAAKLIEDLKDRISFHIYGDALKRVGNVLTEKNYFSYDRAVLFHDMIPKRCVPKVLSEADLLLAPVLNLKRIHLVLILINCMIFCIW